MKNIIIKIPVKNIQYSIDFFDNFSDLFQSLIKQIDGRNYLVVTDENVYVKSPFFKENSEKFGKNLLILPAGEQQKTWETSKKILDKAFELNFDRNSVFVAIGGGVYGDLVGFASSVFMRGIPFIQVPTTLLAMVDSSVGGKTGFDCEYGKNLIGSFHQPEAVLCCPKFLETLPEIEVKNGLCEMIKHGIITSPKHFDNLKKVSKLNLEEIAKLIPDSINIKKEIVQQDEKEAGVRGYLNLGHTFGHGIEHLSNFEIPHGQAVAIGCVMAAQFAAERGICKNDLIDQIEDIFNHFEINLECEFSEKEIFNAMTHDKKKKNGNIRLILPKKIGEVDYFELN